MATKSIKMTATVKDKIGNINIGEFKIGVTYKVDGIEMAEHVAAAILAAGKATEVA